MYGSYCRCEMIASFYQWKQMFCNSWTLVVALRRKMSTPFTLCRPPLTQKPCSSSPTIAFRNMYIFCNNRTSFAPTLRSNFVTAMASWYAGPRWLTSMRGSTTSEFDCVDSEVFRANRVLSSLQYKSDAILTRNGRNVVLGRYCIQELYGG